MDEHDLHLRALTYEMFVELGRSPAAEEVASRAALGVEDVRAGWRRLHDAHALVLNRSGDEIRMANPFSGVPTAYRVHAGDRWWYANCAWDAFGIGAALGVESRIETWCPDCRTRIELHVRGNRPDDDSLVFHVLVPAVSWWQDIGFT